MHTHTHTHIPREYVNSALQKRVWLWVWSTPHPESEGLWVVKVLHNGYSDVSEVRFHLQPRQRFGCRGSSQRPSFTGHWGANWGEFSTEQVKTNVRAIRPIQQDKVKESKVRASEC